MRQTSTRMPTEQQPNRSNNTRNHGGFFGWFTGGSGSSNNKVLNDGSNPRAKQAPIKIEPKIFFSNERTFLAWMHISVILAGASIYILALGGKKPPVKSTATSIPEKDLYGIITLPVAIAFILYSMYNCKFCGCVAKPTDLWLLDILTPKKTKSHAPSLCVSFCNGIT